MNSLCVGADVDGCCLSPCDSNKKATALQDFFVKGVVKVTETTDVKPLAILCSSSFHR